MQLCMSDRNLESFLTYSLENYNCCNSLTSATYSHYLIGTTQQPFVEPLLQFGFFDLIGDQ